jgi:hypothetical protein
MSRGILGLVRGFISMLRNLGGVRIIRCIVMSRRNSPKSSSRNSHSIRLPSRSPATPWVPIFRLKLC